MILDILMPGLDGLTVLKKLRAAGRTTPVLLLTAKDAVADRVAGLDGGADDYLVKPFALEELSARAAGDDPFRGRDEKQRADRRGSDAGHRHPPGRPKWPGDRPLRREYALLEYLMLNQGIVLSREKSRTTCGILIMRAAPTWWTFTFAICAKRLMKATRKN